MNHKFSSKLLFGRLLLFAISGCQSQTDSNSFGKTTSNVPANSGANQSNAPTKVAQPQTIKFTSEGSVEIVVATYGSSPAIIYAAENPKVKAVALHSPAINYFGNMPTDTEVIGYGTHPLLLVAADDNKESAETVKKLRLMYGENCEVQI